MNSLDIQLKELIQKILSNDRIKSDRTGYGTKSIFGYQIRVNMSEGFPLTTLRKIHIKTLIHELLWFLGSYDEKYKKFGNTNIKYLLDNGVTIWTEWCYENYKKNIIGEYKKLPKDFKILTQKEFESKIVEDDQFALKWGDLGPTYGKQWIDWGGYNEYLVENLDNTNNININNQEQKTKIYIKGINQINKAIETLINEPNSRRIIVSAWNVEEIDDTLLPPCHILFQFYTTHLTLDERFELLRKKYSEDAIKEYMEKNNLPNLDDINHRERIEILDHFNIPERKLDLLLYQRSADLYLGVPYNISEYSLLLHMIAQVVNMIPNEFIWMAGDVHIYSNAIEASQELLKREIRPLPKLWLNPEIKDIYSFRYDDIKIIDYNPHPNIKVDVAV